MSEYNSSLPWITDESLNDVLDAFKNTHALLLTGPQAIGKSNLAAKACKVLLDKTPNHNTTSLIQAGTHPDLHVLTSAYSHRELDSALKNSALRYLDAEALTKKRLSRQIGIDSIRMLISNMSESSALGGYKVAVIYPAEDLNKNSANALLKFLEEPSDQTLIILVSHDISKLSATIRSRCVRLNMTMPGLDVSKQWLRQIYPNNNDIDNALALTSNQPLLAHRYLQDDQQTLVNSLINDVEQLVLNDSVNIIYVARKWVKFKQTDFILNWLCRLSSDLIKVKTQTPNIAIAKDYKNKLQTISAQLSFAKLFEIYDYYLSVNQGYDGVTDEVLLIEDLIMAMTHTKIENDRI